MSGFDLVVRAARVVRPSGVEQCDIAVIDGRIEAIGSSINENGTAEIDARGLYAFPGLIDVHVHFNEPGRTHWEGFASGSRAFAAGGGTTYADMPLNSTPPVVTAERFREKAAAAARSSLVDYALWGGLIPGNLGDLEGLAACGVIGFKAFMCSGGTPDFPPVDDRTLAEGMKRAASLDRVVAVHAESNDQIARLTAVVRNEGKRSLRDYLDSRPVAAELEAIERAIHLAAETGCRLHIVHVSTGGGVALVAAARRASVDVSCETCPHYLIWTEDDLHTVGMLAKCAPPLRGREEREALWEHVAAGDVQIVSSDHSPAPPELKDTADAFTAWGGITGCQTVLQSLLTAGYEERVVPLSTIAMLTAQGAARRFRLFPQKGQLGVGSDADLALIDLEASSVLAADALFYRHRSSPFIGKRLRGRIVRTLLRGQPVFADGTVIEMATGRLVVPNASVAANSGR